MKLTVLIISASDVFDLTAEQNYTFIGQFDNGGEGLKAVEEHKPTIVILDYDLELENTDLYINSLLAESSETKLILLGENLSDKIILSSFSHGSFGYLDWVDVDKFLVKAIQIVAEGEAWVSRRHLGLLLEKNK